MGIGIFDGESLAQSLLATAANCRKCGSSISCEKGQGGAQERGIKESNVVVCPKCSAIFTIRLVPGSLTLLEDVTEKYPK
ncbi:MAG: hypothetical protein ABII93_02275 [Chrysiogenia bacterium]